MSWEYIDERMTFPRYKDILRYQKAHPPIHIMVATYLGLNKPDQETETPAPAESLFDLMPQGPKFKPG